jgi:predicted nucleic acid-binding protein
MVVVSNSTPLIALSKIGLFYLLEEYFGEVVIPNEVYEEVVTRGGDLFGAKEVSNSKWVTIIKPKNRLAIDSLSMHLGKGEAEAIILAKEKNTLLIIDDKDGRTMAANLGIPVTGTVGLLKLASEDGKIDLKKTLEELVAMGFRLSKSEYEKIIADD